MEIKELVNKSRTSVDEQSSVAQELDQLKKEYASYKEEVCDLWRLGYHT